jgi:serine/threonine protein kinase
LSEEKSDSEKTIEVLPANSAIHCFACGKRTDLSGCCPGDKINCEDCSVEITVPDSDVIKKLASLESFTQVPEPEEKKEPVVEKIHKIFCQGCGAKIDVTGQAVDARFSCPACGMVLKVPAMDDGKPEEKKPEETSEKKTPSESTPQKLKINCHTCGAKLDVTGEEAFKKVNCPACNATFQIPKRYSHFLLEQRLGETKNFSVYRALDLTLSREVCLKVMKEELSQNKEMVEKFLSEAGKTALVNDPNVVPIYSSGEHEGCSYLVMQFMAALSLKPYLEKSNGILPISSVLRVVKEAARGLDAAQKQGILHSNVSLNNILLDSDGNVKVSDFSFDYSLYQSSEDKSKLLDFFDPQYISLEMVKDGDSCLAGDIYSLGAVFYHLITGVPPFPGDDPEKIIKERLERTPIGASKLRSEIPQEISDYIASMMSDEKTSRPSSFKDIADKIESFINGNLKASTLSSQELVLNLDSVSSGNDALENSSGESEDSLSPAKKIPAIVYAIVAALVVVIIVIFNLPKQEEKVGPTMGEKIDKNLIKSRKAAVVATPVVAPEGPSVAVVEAGAESAEVVDDPLQAGEIPTSGGGFPVKVTERPSPDGLGFKEAGEDIFAYLEKHQGEAHNQEMMRLKTLRNIKSYLVSIVSSVPYQGKIFVQGRNALDGSIVAATEDELTIKPDAADQTLALSWQQFDVKQFVSMFEYYINLRSEQLGEGLADSTVQRDLAADYFRLALLCDWYKMPAESERFAALSLQNDSQLKRQVMALLPSISE